MGPRIFVAPFLSAPLELEVELINRQAGGHGNDAIAVEIRCIASHVRSMVELRLTKLMCAPGVAA